MKSEFRRKITFVTSSMNLGGAERQLLQLCNLLKDQAEIEIISLDSKGPLLPMYRRDFPNIRVLDPTSLSIFSLVVRLQNLMKKTSPDVVITWLYKADILGGIAAKLVGNTPVIWSARNSAIPNFNRLKKLTLVVLSKMIPTYVVANGLPASRFHISIGYRPDKIKIIPNLLSSWVPTAKSKSRLLGAIDQNRELRIGIAARQVSGKGILETIKSISMLPTDFVKIDLSLIGQQTSESEVWKSSGLYKNYEVETKVSDPDLAAWFEGLDIYLMPSTSWESHPNSLFEAMAIGCPILFSNLFEFDPQLSADLSFNPLSPADFQRAIQGILDQSSDKIVDSTEHLQKYIMNLTDAKHVGSAWMDLIKVLDRNETSIDESDRSL